MPDKTDFQSITEAQKQAWAKRMFEHAREPSWLAQQIPKPAPLPRTQRWRRNVEAARLRVGSWIAGVHLGER